MAVEGRGGKEEREREYTACYDAAAAGGDSTESIRLGAPFCDSAGAVETKKEKRKCTLGYFRSRRLASTDRPPCKCSAMQRTDAQGTGADFRKRLFRRIIALSLLALQSSEIR